MYEIHLPRVPLGFFPTPVMELPNLSGALGGPRLFMKRDDLTGLAFGGNKTRKFDFVMADAQAAGATAVITGAASQSNHARQAAAAAARLGMKCVLVNRHDHRSQDIRQFQEVALDLLGVDVFAP